MSLTVTCKGSLEVPGVPSWLVPKKLLAPAPRPKLAADAIWLPLASGLANNVCGQSEWDWNRNHVRERVRTGKGAVAEVRSMQSGTRKLCGRLRGPARQNEMKAPTCATSSFQFQPLAMTTPSLKTSN